MGFEVLYRMDWVRQAEAVPGLERIEAYFHAKAYGWHRHDTYAIGSTLAGVQSFRYRGATVRSVPGRTIVLHPDEPHDGQAGTDAGFRYRMLYIEPARLQAMLGGQPLPFIAGAVSTDPRLAAAVHRLLHPDADLRTPLARDDALFDLAQSLAAAGGKAGDTSAYRARGDYTAATRAHDHLTAHWREGVTLEDLERSTGRDRWQLARDFRRYYGTSPYRYVVQRRLAEVRRLLATPMPLADIAAATGFADQSHMTRQFTATVGVPPARWRALARR